MDVAGAWKFRISSQSLVLIIPLATVLAASIFWNLRQHRLIEQKHMADQRTEAALAKQGADRAAARLKKNAEWAASDARVQKLYQEISNFSQIQERLTSEPQRKTLSKIDNLNEPDGSP